MIKYNDIKIASRMFLDQPLADMTLLKEKLTEKGWTFVDFLDDPRYENNPPQLRDSCFLKDQAALVFTKEGVEIIDHIGLCGVTLRAPILTRPMQIDQGYWSNIPDTVDDFYKRQFKAQMGILDTSKEVSDEEIREWKKKQKEENDKALAELRAKIKFLGQEDDLENATDDNS